MRDKLVKTEWFSLLTKSAAGALAFVILIAVISPSRHASTSTAEIPERSERPPITENDWAHLVEGDLNLHKQQVFEAFHPVGTAKSITVHEISIQWKHGRPTANLDDIATWTARFTIYWEGPVEKDGYTKVETLWDNESHHYTSTRLLATNGIHNKEIRDGLVGFGIGFLQEYLRDGSR